MTARISSSTALILLLHKGISALRTHTNPRSSVSGLSLGTYTCELIHDTLTRMSPPTSPLKRPVHLFLGEVLLANRWTHRERPSDYYVVDGDTYDVVSYRKVTEPNGSSGFAAQLAARP